MNFDEASHEYTHNGVTYTSTTQLLKKYGLTADYANIPKAVLEKAAKKGKAVHKALELYIKGDKSMIGLYKEVKQFDNYIKVRNINISTAQAESIYFDTNYEVAGTVDIQYDDGNDHIVADFKTTSKLHLEAVSWQLSIYNYLISKGDMIQYYFNKLKVIHFTAGRFYVKDIHTVDYDAVVALLDAHKRRDKTFTYVKPNKIVTPSDETLIAQILNEKQVHENALDKLDQELKIVTDKVKDNFVKQKEYAYENNDIKLTYVAPVHRKSLNQKKAKEFIEQHGGNLDDFFNETVSKDKVRVKLKKKPQNGDVKLDEGI